MMKSSYRALISKPWDEFFTSIIFHMLFPLLPICLEFFGTGSVAPSSLILITEVTHSSFTLKCVTSDPKLPNWPHHVHNKDGTVHGMMMVPDIFYVIDQIEEALISLSC